MEDRTDGKEGVMNAATRRRVNRLKLVGRITDGLQIIIMGTMGQYLHSGGSQKLSGKHWDYAKDFFGGYQNIGSSLMIITLIGFIGLFSLAFTDTDTVYTVIMWIFSVLAAAWFIGIGITHGYAAVTIPGAGSTGLWTLGLAGLFFLFSRIVITITNSIRVEESQ